MVEAHELPGRLGAIHPRFRTPHYTILLIGLTCAVVSLFLDLRKVIPLANVFTLVWYSVTNGAALRLRAAQRLMSPIGSWCGLAGCALMFAWQPLWALVAGCSVLLSL